MKTSQKRDRGKASAVGSLGQLAWTSDWHIREETYAMALQRLVNQQQREPLAALFGAGTSSSSDGQFFRARGLGRDGASHNAHYGDEPGGKFYTTSPIAIRRSIPR